MQKQTANMKSMRKIGKGEPGQQKSTLEKSQRPSQSQQSTLKSQHG